MPEDVGTKLTHDFVLDHAAPSNSVEIGAAFSHIKKKSREVAWAPRTAALSFALEDTATYLKFSGQRHGATQMTRVDARTCPHAGGALFPSIKGGWTYKTTKLTP